MSIFECKQEIRELQKKKRQLVKDSQKSCEFAGDVSEIDRRVKQLRKKHQRGSAIKSRTENVVDRQEVWPNYPTHGHENDIKQWKKNEEREKWLEQQVREKIMIRAASLNWQKEMKTY